MRPQFSVLSIKLVLTEPLRIRIHVAACYPFANGKALRNLCRNTNPWRHRRSVETHPSPRTSRALGSALHDHKVFAAILGSGASAIHLRNTDWAGACSCRSGRKYGESRGPRRAPNVCPEVLVRGPEISDRRRFGLLAVHSDRSRWCPFSYVV